MSIRPTPSDLVSWYGDGRDGSSPTREQWSRLLARPGDAPLLLVNLFKMRATARYPEDARDAEVAPGLSGPEAFARYAAVSGPALERAGGRFVYVGPHGGAFCGDEEDWDLVAIGSYPGLSALVALISDDEYREAWRHRRAACERQRVFVCAG